ncbi:MAG: MTH938/NDUFAF3 family protein [Nitrospirota bacterium]
MAIDDYTFGRITIDGQRYNSDVIVLPDEVRDGWWRKEGHSLAIDDLDAVVDAAPAVLVVGTGYYGRMAVPDDTRRWLAGRGIEVRIAPTSEAAALLNQLLEADPDGCVVGAFHLTC